MSNDVQKTQRTRGRPRLHEEPCTIRIGLPLTESDNRALEELVAQTAMSGKRSKQEVIRGLIRASAPKQDEQA